MGVEEIIDILSMRGVTLESLIYSQTNVSVYKGKYNSFQVAIKVQHSINSDIRFVLEREFTIMLKVRHTNALKIYYCFWEKEEDPRYLVFVTEWCNKNLRKEIEHRRTNSFPFTEAEVWDSVKTLVGVFAYLQTINIAHRDIKPANIFYGANKVLMVGDFGSATENIGDWSEIIGTPGYMSPKLNSALNDRSSTQFVHNAFKSDVFSLGVTLYEMISLQLPSVFVYSLQVQESINQLIGALPCSDNMKALLQAMLTTEESNRGDFVEFEEWLNPKVPSPIAFSIPKEVQHPVPSEIHPGEYSQIEVVNPQAIAPVEVEIEVEKQPILIVQPPIIEESKSPSCLSCKQDIDVFGENAKFEVVPLECDPQHHMFCTRNCFLQWGQHQRNKAAVCPMCKSPIPESLFDVYKETDRGPLLHSSVKAEKVDIESESKVCTSNPHNHTEISVQYSGERDYKDNQSEAKAPKPKSSSSAWKSRLHRSFEKYCCLCSPLR